MYTSHSGQTLRRIYRHDSTEFPFELAHENGAVNCMKEFHWHDFLEITYVEKGEGTYYIEGKVIPVQAGDFLIINNIERHKVEFSSQSPFFETVFHFDASILDHALRNEYNLFDYNSSAFYNKLRPSNQDQVRLEQIMRIIIEEFKGKQACFELCIISQLIHFVAIATRSGGIYRQSLPEKARNSANIARMERILKYLAANLEAETTLQSVAKHFFLNPSYFSEYFKRMMGVTFTEYMRELRVSRAVQLMEEDSEKILNIAYDCGFSSLSAFYEAFAKVHGMPPQKYISQKKRNLSK